MSRKGEEFKMPRSMQNAILAGGVSRLWLKLRWYLLPQQKPMSISIKNFILFPTSKRGIHSSIFQNAQFDTHALHKELKGNDIDDEKSQAVMAAFSTVLEDR
jgi:hypothetical protein